MRLHRRCGVVTVTAPLPSACPQVVRDAEGRLAPARSTGVSLRVEISYSNRDRETGRAQIGNTNVHADVTVTHEDATWVHTDQTGGHSRVLLLG